MSKPQVSLAAMLFGSFIWALMSLVAFSTPDGLAIPVLALTSVLVPAALTGGIVYGRGPLRAFCIGALFPTGACFLVVHLFLWPYVFDNSFPNPDLSDYETMIAEISLPMRLGVIGSWMAGLVAGLMVVGIHVIMGRKSHERNASDHRNT
jgi:hypothetical protein